MSQLSRLRARLLSVVGLLCLLSTCPETPGQVTDWINPGADNWFNAANWSFGVPGPGAIARIDNGGFALLFDPGGAAAFLSLGFNSSSLLTISGPGNLTLGGGLLDVYGGSDLRIQNGGWLDVVNHPTLGNKTEIGYLGSGTGTVTVTGTSSLLKSGSLYLGINGTGGASNSGNLLVENGGWVDTDGSARLGSNIGKSTTAIVTGDNSRWTIDGTLAVQGDGSSTVTISNRGTVNAAATEIGRNGTITVTGSDSWLNNTSSVADSIIGYLGTGVLNVQNGGLVTSRSAVIGYKFSSPGFIGNGTATVSGANSLWNLSQDLFVGGKGDAFDSTGVLRVQSSGLVQAASLRVANTGSVEVDNGSTTVAGLAISGGAAAPNLNNLGDLSIGVSSNGRMTVSGGGDVWTATGQIGRNAGRSGSATVQGAGSTWNNAGDLLVGSSGTGVLEIRSGASVSNFRGHVGFNGGAVGSVLVTDPGSTWTAAGSFFIGNGGSGSLQVLNGAAASTAGNSYLGFATFSQGTATVSGAGSTWSTANTLYIGGNGDGPGGPFASTLRIENGGLVNAGATVLHNTGILELTDASTLNSPLSSRGGLIRTFGPATHAGPISLDVGNLSVTCGTLNTTATLSGVLSGPGGFTKSGIAGFTGNLRLTANNTYTGPTTINAGTLFVDGSIASATTVNNGGTLGGSGTVGPVTVMSGGTLAPGAGVGSISASGVSFRSGGNYALDLRTSGAGAPGTDWDSLAITGALDISTLSAANPFNIRLSSLDGANQPGALPDWNPGADHTWTSVITTTGGFSGPFDTSLFRFDTTSFPNRVQGKFQLVPNGDNLDLVYDATEVGAGVLVTNLDQPLRAATPIGNNPNPVDPPEGPGFPWYWAAQKFRSDGFPHELVSIQARVGNGSTAPAPVVVARLHTDNAGAIGELISTFTAPDVSAAPSDLAFVPDQPTTLDPNGSYWFVLGSANPGDGTFAWEYINTSEAAGAGVLLNYADSTSSGEEWIYRSTEFPYYFQVNVATNIPGDFNGDDAVDAADYTVLRDNAAALEEEFEAWRVNFDEAPADALGGAISQSVPEPPTVVLLMLALSAGCIRPRGSRSLLATDC